MRKRLGRVYCAISPCNVLLGSIHVVLFTLIDFLLRRKLVHSTSLYFATVFTTFIARGDIPPLAFSFALSSILYPTLRQRTLSRGILPTRFKQPFFGVKIVRLSALVKSSSFTLYISTLEPCISNVIKQLRKKTFLLHMHFKNK